MPRTETRSACFVTHALHMIVALAVVTLLYATPSSARSKADSAEERPRTVTKCGIDNLLDTRFALLKGKRIVLVTHAAARAASGRSTFEEFSRSTDVQLIRVLTPEHGYYGITAAGATVLNDTIDGTVALSLYGSHRKPTREMLDGADVVVVDLQDIGTRSYTFMSTMIEVMEACAEFNIPITILDRPNPLGGVIVDGNLPEDTLRSFVCRIPIPYVHGLTLGEIATMTNGELWLGKDRKGLPRQCSLTVVRCKRWLRRMQFEETGLTWYPTSPNIPTIHAVRGYPVTGLLGELGGTFIGISSPSPFTVIGAPYLNFDSILVYRLKRNGTAALQARLVPSTGRYANTTCTGYYLAFESTEDWHPYLSGLELVRTLASTIRANDPSSFSEAQKTMFKKVTGSTTLLEALVRDDWSTAEREASRGVSEFKSKRKQYLLYQ